MYRHSAKCILVVAVLSIAPKESLGADVRVSVSTYETFVGSPIQIDITIENAKQHEMPVFPTVDGAEILESGSSTRSFVSITLSGRANSFATPSGAQAAVYPTPGILRRTGLWAGASAESVFPDARVFAFQRRGTLTHRSQDDRLVTP